MSKRTWGWVGVVAMTASIAVSAAAQAPQPGPEVGKLSAFAGNWQYEGSAKASPLGPASKISGKQTGRSLANGAAFASEGQESGPFGGILWGETDTYDAASKTYRYLGYQNDGSIWQGTGTVNGNVWKWDGTMTVKGTAYRVRSVATFTADGNSFTWKSDLSTDGGKTWTPWTETKTTKVP